MTSSKEALARIRLLCANVEALVVQLEGQERNADNIGLMGRLRASVVRPMRNILDATSLEPAAPAANAALQADQAPDAVLWTLTCDATSLVTNPSTDSRLCEAVAGDVRAGYVEHSAIGHKPRAAALRGRERQSFRDH
jgi:hypothetical protein